MIRAAIDPGSRWIAVTITRDDGPDAPCNYVDARCIEVGRWAEFAPTDARYHRPKIVNGVELYSALGAHAASPADRDAAADEVAAYLIEWGVEACDVENVEGVFAATAQAASAAAKALIAAAKIVTRALTLWEVSRKSLKLSAPVVLILATSWRARVTPLIKAGMRARGEVIAGVLIRGKGAALEPVLVAHVSGWPGSASFLEAHREHIRDSTGLALACGMPAPPARAKGAARPRGPRVRGASKARPRGSRARATMGPIDLEKYRATDRARDQRHRDEARPALLATREAAGCLCRAPGARMSGRHKRSCPMHKGVCPV